MHNEVCDVKLIELPDCFILSTCHCIWLNVFSGWSVVDIYFHKTNNRILSSSLPQVSMIRHIARSTYPKLVSRIMSSQSLSQGMPNKKLKLATDGDNIMATSTTEITTTNVESKPTESSTDNEEKKQPSLQSMMQTLINSKKPVWKPLVWIDCEMTGLNVFEDHIIEICCIITDGNLNIIDEEGFESTVYYPKETMDNMNEWCVNQHGKSGLTAKILDNPQCELSKVQDDLLNYIKQHVELNRGIMAGNSIHMDKFFMMREFPKVVDYLHYRLIDVSSIMEIGYRHNPELMKLYPKKQGNHTARSDILESIDQLKWYKKNYLKSDTDTKELIEKNKQLESDAPTNDQNDNK